MTSSGPARLSVAAANPPAALACAQHGSVLPARRRLHAGSSPRSCTHLSLACPDAKYVSEWAIYIRFLLYDCKAEAHACAQRHA